MHKYDTVLYMPHTPCVHSHNQSEMAAVQVNIVLYIMLCVTHTMSALHQREEKKMHDTRYSVKQTAKSTHVPRA